MQTHDATNTTPATRRAAKRVRRVLSHHGSDCDQTPHSFRGSRCMILTRIDHPDGTSESWVSGDCQEGRRFQYGRHSFDASKPTYYGGGFWEAVCIPALEAGDA